MKKTKVKPFGDRVVVQRKEAETTKGGILLPESAQQKPRQGTVLAVGSGTFDEKGVHRPVDLKVGDVVLFSSYAGTEYKGDSEDCLIIAEDDVLAVLE